MITENNTPLPPKFIIHRDKIIKVIEETKFNYVGFDILSENLFSITKNSNAIELPEVVIKLIGCEKSRLKLANCLEDRREKIAKLMGMSDRTLYRCYKVHGMIPDDLLNDKGQIVRINMRLIKKSTKQKSEVSKPKQKLLTDGKKKKAA